MLADGGTISEVLDLSVVFGEIDSDTSAIWSQLYLAGYVTTRDVEEPNNSMLARRLEIPNLEVRRLFQNELVERAYAAAGSRGALATLDAQALPKRYAHGLAGVGTLLYGVAFDASKHVAVACART